MQSMTTEDYSKLEDKELETQYLEQKLKCLEIKRNLQNVNGLKPGKERNKEVQSVECLVASDQYHNIINSCV